MATHVLRHMMYGLHIAGTNELKSNEEQQAKQEHNISVHKGSTTHGVLKSHKIKMGVKI